MNDFPVSLERSVLLVAPVRYVWDLISSNEGWAKWWGAGSTIDARKGGAMRILYPNGQTAEGEVLEARAGELLRFTWGYPRQDAPIPVGGSVVTITLDSVDEGTRLTVMHQVIDVSVRDLHVPGWRYQLGLFRSLVSSDYAGSSLISSIDSWHAVWSVERSSERREMLSSLLHPDVEVAEPTAQLFGIDDVNDYIEQSRHFLSGSVTRTGLPALNGNTVVWDWCLTANERIIEGRSVAEIDSTGRFRRITAMWLSAPPGVPASTISTDAAGSGAHLR